MVKAKNSPKLLSKGLPLIWFAIAAFLLYGQSISFHYTYLDDQSLILNSMDKLRSLTFLGKAFSEDVFHSPSGSGFYYRPLLTLTFMADAMIGRGNFAMFHVANIFYHILAVFLLYLFFIETGADRVRSFLFAMLFLAHPMVVQAVAWVPGRNDSLLAILILASFLSWIKFLKSNSNRHLLLHLMFYLLALLTKENAIVLPFLIVFYSAFICRTPLKLFTIPLAGWMVLTATWAIVRYHALGGEHGATLSYQLLSVARSLPAVLPFLGKGLFPVDLSVFPILTDMKVSLFLGIAAIGILIFLATITKPKAWFYYIFCILWFLAFLLPSFVSVNQQIPNFSEHRMYLSLPAILLFMMGCKPVKNTDFSHFMPVASIIGVCLVFCIVSFLHTLNFKDRFAFWHNAVDSSPSHAFNYNNLGAMYFLAGDMTKAEPLFRQALKINPREPMANSNTGLICMNTNRPADAEKYFLEEIRINPRYEHAYFNLGLLYFNHSRQEEGIRQWEKVLTFNHTYEDAFKALLFAYEKSGRTADYERIMVMGKANGVIP